MNYRDRNLKVKNIALEQQLQALYSATAPKTHPKSDPRLKQEKESLFLAYSCDTTFNAHESVKTEKTASDRPLVTCYSVQ